MNKIENCNLWNIQVFIIRNRRLHTVTEETFSCRCLSVSPTAFACRCHSDPKTEKDNILTDKNTKTKLKIQYHARNMYHYIDVTYSRFFMV